MMHLIGKIALTTFILLSLSNCSDQKENEEIDQNLNQVDPIIDKTEYLYGIPVDSFKVVRDKVKKNQFFSQILTKYGINYANIDKMARDGKEIFDVRKLRAGKSYTIFTTNDTLETAQIVVYEINKIEYIVYDLRDNLKIYRAKKPVTVETKTASGVITSSLYLTLEQQGYNPELAIVLSEIYAWSIDFYHIQKNDKFKVIYEETMVEGESVGIKRIKAAYFEHFKKPYYAIQFTQEKNSGYYNEENRGLRRQFLKAPVKFSRISSRFSYKRFHPVQKRNKPHLGTDYAAPKGTPIYSTANGIITHAKYSRFNGNYVKVKHNSVYTTQYLHMSKIKKGIRPNVRVKQGDVIGFVGSTGLATGPHVCYRFWKNGKQVDPYRQKLPKSEPIKKVNLTNYEKIKKGMVKELQEIKYPSL